MSDCKKEFDKLVKELKQKSDAIISKAYSEIEQLLADSTKKANSIGGPQMAGQMETAIKKMMDQTNKNMDSIGKNVNSFIVDLEKIGKSITK